MFRAIDRYVGIPVVFLLGILNKLFGKKMPRKDPDRILIFKASALGDTVLLMPVLKAIRESFKSSKISMIATQKNKDILAGCPYIDDLHVLDLNGLLNPLYLARFVLNVRKFKPDLAIDFDQWTRSSAILCFLSGAKKRVGFRTSGQARHYLYTDIVEHKKDKHEITLFEDIAGMLNIKPVKANIGFLRVPKGIEEAKTLLAKHSVKSRDVLIGMHPACGKKGVQRAWPKEKYVELIEKILTAYPAKIMLTGAPDEIEVCRYIADRFPARVHNAAGCLSLQGLVSLLEKFSLFITGNNGIMHIASALDVPLIALHGPTDPKRWGPISSRSVVIKSDLDCSPCLYLGFEYACGQNKCMDYIPVDKVFSCVSDQLKGVI